MVKSPNGFRFGESYYFDLIDIKVNWLDLLIAFFISLNSTAPM